MKDNKCGGVVLCGGKSSRMGRDKATLPFGDETMLMRVTRILAQVVDPIVVVAAPDQPLTELGVPVTYVRDRVPDRGPLEGLAVGIDALKDDVDCVYATSCDVPLLVADFVRYLTRVIGDHEIAVPKEEKYFHPLAAVYRVSVLPKIEELLSADRLRPMFLFNAVETLAIPVSQLTKVDPQLTTLMNLNSPDDYVNALGIAGYDLSKKLLAELFPNQSN